MKKIISTMKNQISNAPATIEPFYFCKNPNEVFEIYNGPILVESPFINGECTIGSGNIIQQWLPEPSIKYCMSNYKHISNKEQLKIENKDYLLIGKSKSTLTIHVQPIVLCPSAKRTQSEKSSSTYSGAIEEPIIIGTDQSAQSVKFHIVNLWPYEGKGIRNGSKSRLWRGRLKINCEQWDITIDALEYFSKEMRDKLQTQNGYAITHVAQAWKKDGSRISLSECDLLQNILFYFFYSR